MNISSFDYPLVTVVMPVKNESSYLLQSMLTIIEQDYPIDRIDLMIVDGMSIDDTRQKIIQFISQYPNRNIELLDNPRRTVAPALNIALRKAKGEIIIRVDGHCVIAPDYVARCVHHLLNDGVDGVGGPMETVGETTVAQAIALSMSSPFGVGNSAFRTLKNETKLVDTVPFPAYRRETIEELGLFDEELVRNQDDEYNYRLRKMGKKVLLAEDVRSKYYSRSSLKSLFKQYFQYGFWKVRVLQKHPAQMKLRQFIPLLFVFSLLASVLMTLFTTWGIITLALIFGSYILVNLIASVWTARRGDWKVLALLPLTYAIIHFSYGLGFLGGLIRFIHRWGDKEGKVPVLREVHA